MKSQFLKFQYKMHILKTQNSVIVFEAKWVPKKNLTHLKIYSHSFAESVECVFLHHFWTWMSTEESYHISQKRCGIGWISFFTLFLKLKFSIHLVLLNLQPIDFWIQCPNYVFTFSLKLNETRRWRVSFLHFLKFW